jgi:hypothetical protein
MQQDDFDKIKDILDKALEGHLRAIHEEITDLGDELRGSIDANRAEVSTLRKEVADGFLAVTSRLGGVDNRIDNETFARNDLERRVRRVLPHLPHAEQS